MTVQDSKPGVHVCFGIETPPSPTINPLKTSPPALSLKPLILLLLQLKRT